MIQPRPRFADNLLKCTRHSKDIDSFSLTNDFFGYTKTRLLCSQCQVDNLDEKPTKAFFKAYSNLETFTMSIPNVPKPSSEDPFTLNTTQDFFNHQLEQVIIDYKSKGYGPRNLVYIHDKQLLAACSSSGRILIWSMGDNVTFREEFDIRKTIKSAKYITFSETKKYLVIAAGLDLHIYDIKQDKVELVKVLGCEWDAIDFDYNSRAGKLIAVGSENSLRMWNVARNFFPEDQESLKEYHIEDPIMTVIYLHDKNQVALEHKKGLSVISLDQHGALRKEGFKHFKVEGRVCCGMEYLPKSNTFIFAKNDGVELIDANTLTTKFKYTPMSIPPNQTPLKFIANQDESQIIAITNKNFFYLFSPQKCHYQSVAGNHLSSVASIQALPDQNRLVLANASSGTLFIFRTNLKSDKSLTTAMKTATPTSDEMKMEQDLISFEGQSPLIPGDDKLNGGEIRSLAGEFNSMIEEKETLQTVQSILKQKDSDEDLPLFDMQDFAFVQLEEDQAPVSCLDQKRKWMKDPYLHDEKDEKDPLGLVTFTKQASKDTERIIEVLRERKKVSRGILEEEKEAEERQYVVLWEDDDDYKKRGKVIDWKSETRGLKKAKRSSDDESRSRSRSSSKESERKKPEENKPPRMKTIMDTIKGAKAIMKIINSKCRERKDDD